MGRKITKEERSLIVELLRAGHSPEHVAMLCGRGIRSVYYIQAEERGRPQYEPKPLLKRLYAYLTGGKLYEKVKPERTRSPRGFEI